MNKVIISGLMAALIVSGGFLIQSASADNSDHAFGPHPDRPGYKKMLEAKADILGVSTEKLQEAFANKTFGDLMQEQNIDPEQVHEKMIEKAKARWEEYGLSDEEIAAKEEMMQQRFENCETHCSLGQFMGKGQYGEHKGSGSCSTQTE